MTKMINPAPNGWRGRGWQVSPRHSGVDFGFYNADPEGSQRVVIAADGVVISESTGGGDNNGWGNQYIVDHGFGIYTTYNHLRTGTMQLDVGQKVTAGTYVGQMGETGDADGVHLHFEVRINGSGRDNRVDPGPWLDGTQEIPGGETLAPTQRKAGPEGSNRRVGAPSSKAPRGDNGLGAGEIGNFQGWVYGEAVDGNNMWFVGISGDYFWSGGFEGGADTHDLKDMNPQQPKNTRVVLSDGSVRARKGPWTSYDVATEIAAGASVEVIGWNYGEAVNGINVWFLSTQGWSWAGGFTSQSTDGIPQATAPAKPTDPPKDPDWKHRTPDSSLATWVGSPNFDYKSPRPSGAEPTHVTMHWMAGDLASTDATFQNGAGQGSSATYGIGQTEIHQYVREQDYQQADGNEFSNRWGLSIEHEAGPGNPASQAVQQASAKLLADIAKRYGWTHYVLGTKDMTEAQITAFSAANPNAGLLFWHSKWVATQCPGTLPYSSIMDEANKLLAPEPVPTDEIKLTKDFVQKQVFLAESSVELWKGLL